MPSALGYKGGDGGFTETSCFNANVPSAQVNANLHSEYTVLTKLNKDLMSLAQQIFSKITSFKNVNKNINTEMTTGEQNLKNQLALYANIQILNHSGKDDKTITGQLEDITLKEKSKSMHFLLWGSLAIFVILFAIEQMRK